MLRTADSREQRRAGKTMTNTYENLVKSKLLSILHRPFLTGKH